MIGVILDDFFLNKFFEFDVLVFNNELRSLLSESIVFDGLLIDFGREVSGDELVLFVFVESIVETNECDCLANELRRSADESETRRRDFILTLL